MEEMEEEQRTLTSLETVSVLELVKDVSVRWQLITIIVVNAGMQLSGIDAVCVLLRVVMKMIKVCEYDYNVDVY